MGQYYLVVNVSKGQYMKPHNLGDGAKLMEFAMAGEGIMAALAVLLVSGNGRGGGDLRCSSNLIGSWAGDRIVIAGDYDDYGLFVAEFAAAVGLEVSVEDLDRTSLYSFATDHGRDVSDEIRQVLSDANEPLACDRRGRS